MKVCAHRTPDERCAALTDSTYCERHRKQRRTQADRRRPSASRRGYGSGWRRTRRAFLAAHPACQDESGCIAPATDVHHRDGQGPAGPQGHDWANLQGLCASHHAQITAREQPGGWNA